MGDRSRLGRTVLLKQTVLVAMILILCNVDSADSLTRGKSPVFDGSQVFLYSKQLSHGRIGPSENKFCNKPRDDLKKSSTLRRLYEIAHDDYCALKLYGSDAKYDHVWILQEHPTRKGKYYLKNQANEEHRMSYGTPSGGMIKKKSILSKKIEYMSRNQVGNMMMKTKGKLTNDDLFSFAYVRKGEYYIRSGIDTTYCLTLQSNKFDRVKCSTVKGRLSAIWKLEPRMKLTQVKSEIIYQQDNLQFSEKTEYALTITSGVEISEESSIRNLQSFTQTVEASFEMGGASASLSLEFAQEVENTMTSSQTSTWERSETITIPVPANRKIAIIQFKATLDGEIDTDNMVVKDGTIKIYETKDQYFRDDNGKKIDIYNVHHA